MVTQPVPSQVGQVRRVLARTAVVAIANPSGRSVYSLATVLILPQPRRAATDTWAVIRTSLW
ncbi:MAG: hypothetical protein ACREIS_00320 [Nitrospiraceae bacterium]